MFVRWKKQKRSKKERGVYFLASGFNTHPQHMEKEACLLSAYLVESARIDGKPKQKILSYLGSINDAKITNPGANDQFWKSVDAHLRTLPLKQDQRKEIEQKLQRHVPKVSARALYEMVDLADTHPRNRSSKAREQLEAFRKKHNLPGDEIRAP